MEKEMLHFRDFSFFLKTPRGLSMKEKNEMHKILVRLYPSFKAFYDKNKYYSTLKPQRIFLIRKDSRLIGTGKLLWHSVRIKGQKIKLFAFGILIDNPYQGQGIGREMIKLDKQEAGRRKADLLYGSTNNPIMERMFERAGFKKIKAYIMYKDASTGEIKREENSVYAFEFKKGLIKEINKLEFFYIGIGPI
jgi:RimJ/RimL family protein N-acetyltransferase